MTQVSIIVPCYNSERFLEKALNSIISQTFINWEVIVVNDGSHDSTQFIASKFTELDPRIKLISKENGGYVSARLYGLQYISPESKYLLFFDSDDILFPSMLSSLVSLLEGYPNAGAAFCNHLLIDENDKEIGLPSYGTRLVPTKLWMKSIREDEILTPFISIFCWTTRMIEPMTLIRKKAYLKSKGWDSRFGKGVGNIGEGVLLFSEIALTWDVLYIQKVLYQYRKHKNQATNSVELNKKASNKVLCIWNEYYEPDFNYKRDIKGAIVCYKYRLYAYSKCGSLRYTLRFRPLNFIPLIFSIIWHWMLSLQLFFYKDTKIFKYS